MSLTGHAAVMGNAQVPRLRRRRPPRGPLAPKRIADLKAAVLDRLSRGVPAERVLEHIATFTGPLMPSTAAAFLVADSGQENLVGLVSPDFPAAYVGRMLTPIRPEHGPAATAALRRETVTVEDCAHDDRWLEQNRAASEHGVASLTAQPVLNAQGLVLGVLVLFHRKRSLNRVQIASIIEVIAPLAAVVLEHNRRANALRTADERLSSLAANLPGAIYQRVVHPDGKIRYTYISEGARDLFGASPAEIIANPDVLFQRHGPAYGATFRENLLAASRELRMWDVEAQLVTRDGEEKWTHAKARPRLQPDGSVIWDGIILDSTRIKQANLALAAANRAKSEFLAIMSHELRTPLNAIIGFSEIMASEAMGPLGNEHYREYLTDILASGRHLLSLINDILDLSKIEAGHLELNEGTIDVLKAIDGCIRLVKPRADDNKLILSVHCSAAEPNFFGDERKFRQIVTNLLSNAVKFTPEGGSVTVEIRDSPEGDLVIAVADTGIGIPPEALPKVCQAFVQVDAGHSRKYEGTGLGLALCKALTEAHGGTLFIESAVGVGTKVSLTFPAATRKSSSF